MTAAGPATAGTVERDNDAAARKLAATSFGRPLILEAGAGTGKTAVLVARTIVWTLSHGFDRARERLGRDASEEACAAEALARTVAVTFTDSAAAEMSQRVAKALAELAQGTEVKGCPRAWIGLDPATLRQRANAAQRSIDHFQASTIHGFCRRILLEHPIEAGLHPGFQIDDDGRRTGRVVDAIIARAALTAARDPSSDLVALACRGVDPPVLADALETLVREGHDASLLPLDVYGASRVEAAVERLRGALQDFLGLVEEPLARGKGRLDGARDLVDALKALHARLDDGMSAERLLLAVSGVAGDDKAMSRLGQWETADFTATEIACFPEDETDIAEISKLVRRQLRVLGRIDPEVLPRALRILAPLVESARQQLVSEGIVGFPVLLERAAAVLRESPLVREAVKLRIDQLLVDEFQDTDPLQYEIVGLLALEGPESSRPGLFLVGDPKQSIYAWRGADLAAYDRFKDRVLRAGGGRHSLCVNYRSVAAILDEVTRIIEPVMIDEPGVQPAFERLWEGRKPPDHQALVLDGGRAAVEHWIAWLPLPVPPAEAILNFGPRTSADDAASIQARAVAADLRELHDRQEQPLAWKETALLFRKNNQIEPYLEALRNADIPYQIERDTGFFRRREVIDAISLMQAILDPHDQLALVSLLRSPFVGVPDVALIPLFAGELPSVASRLGVDAARDHREIEALIEGACSAVARVAASVPGIEAIDGWPLLLADALQGLSALRRSLRCDSADRFLDRVRDHFLPEITEAARARGEYRVANLERFYRRCHSLMTDEGLDAPVLERELLAALEEARDESEGRPGDAEIDAVRIMTIHKAKGLTFRQVYVVGLDARAGRGTSPPALDAAHRGGRLEVDFNGVPSLDFDLVQATRERTERVERVRLLYVAATRPEGRLVLAGKWPDPAKKTVPLARAGSLLALVGHRKGPRPDLDTLLSDAAGRTSATRGADGVLWKIPVTLEDSGTVLVGSVATIDAAAIARTRTRLQTARIEAKLVASRPMTTKISTQERAGSREEQSRIEILRDTGAVGQLDDEDAAVMRSRDAARELGILIHDAFEHLDLDRPVDDAIRAARLRAKARAGFGNSPEARAQATAEGLQFFDRIDELGWFRRLHALQSTILARELPVLVGGDGAETTPERDTTSDAGARVGTIDLLYRDAASGELVIADYKTSQVAGDPPPAGRHQDQGRGYQEAVQRALRLPTPPRFELWWVTTAPPPRVL